ncbi:MAG: hypothetical protein HRU05_02135 [Oceanospirillaceae bacterium]|nr:hypothetical protein [Oceanospirillaceae bacterium]
MNLLKFNIISLLLLILFTFIILFFELSFMTTEDGVVEYLSALFWLIGVIFSFFVIKTKKRKFIPIIFLFVCFISLGEEISWGQRILNVSTPDFMAQANKQNELNFHNLHIFSGGSTWQHFFKTGEFNYHQLLDTQNIFRIGFITFFFLFPLLIRLEIGARLANTAGYKKPETYFTIFVLFFIVGSFLITSGKTIDERHVIQEIREMSFAFFIALYFISVFYSTKEKELQKSN